MSSRHTLSIKMPGIALLGGVLLAVVVVVTACSPSESAQDSEPESTLDVAPILARCVDSEAGGFSVWVDSVKDASALAGFDVHRPSSVDSALVPASKGIAVSGGTEPQTPDFCRTRVRQTWADPDTDGGISYVQEPTHGRKVHLGGGEPTFIGDVSGERAFIESKGDSPDKLVLTWEQDGVQHTVAAMLGGIVTEDSVERFAAMAQARK